MREKFVESETRVNLLIHPVPLMRSYKTSRPVLQLSDVKEVSEESNVREEMFTNTTAATTATSATAVIEELKAISIAKTR